MKYIEVIPTRRSAKRLGIPSSRTTRPSGNNSSRCSRTAA
jgi:hypothetical protein